MAATGLLIRKRMLILLCLFTASILALVVRIFWIQFIEAEDLQKKAYSQQNRGRVISPRRGTIYDRNGKELAVSASVETVSANPQSIRKSGIDPEYIATKLSAILGMKQEDVLKRITQKASYVFIKRKVEKEIGDSIRKWMEEEKLPGIYVDEDTKRFYPMRNLAAHIIGFTGTDNQGLDGIEKMMEEYLKGVPGKILSEVDARGSELPFNTEKHIDPRDGLNVVLTIDETIQYLAEKNIEKAIDDNNVLEGALAIVMDPRNGEILALVSKPDFDLNNPFAAPPGVDASTWKGNTNEEINILRKGVWRDKAVSDTYEPGSTFKSITSSAGLEEGVVKPDSPVNDFTVKVGGWNINCWKPNFHGNETFTQGVYHSCNPVFVRVAQGLGIERFYKYVKAFGFYEKTNIDLPGEAGSIFHKKPAEVDMAAASFGQRFQITPIQLITAYCAIANGGKLLRPHLVKDLTDQDGNVVKKFEPEVIRNVISKQTSDTMRQILEGVVADDSGTGGLAYVRGYRVAGKTGTSETTETKTKKRYIASFMAFAPADNPVICALVVMDHPNVYPYTGGMIAAPLAGKLVEDVLDYLAVDRRYTEKDKEIMKQEVTVPDVRNKPVKEAEKILKELGLESRIESREESREENSEESSEAVVMEQTPKPYSIMPKESLVVLYTYKPDRELTVKVPDTINQTVSEAARTLRNAGLNIKINGIGTAAKQSVQPGSKLPRGEVVEVYFRIVDTE